MAIKLFRLVTGEEIIGQCDDASDSKTFKIENPCILAIAMGQNGQPALNMQPWTLFSDEKYITIKDDHVIFTTGVDIKIQNKYNEIFGSGIVIAQPKIIS